MMNTAHSDDPRVERGLALLRTLEYDELRLPEVMDRIEIISSDPSVIRQILDQAELEGIIERDSDRVLSTTSSVGSFEKNVIKKEGNFTCQRCGHGLSTGYFLNPDVGEEIGPFGSSCIRKVVGWD